MLKLDNTKPESNILCANHKQTSTVKTKGPKATKTKALDETKKKGNKSDRQENGIIKVHSDPRFKTLDHQKAINFPPLCAPQSIVNVRHPFVTEARAKYSDNAQNPQATNVDYAIPAQPSYLAQPGNHFQGYANILQLAAENSISFDEGVQFVQSNSHFPDLSNSQYRYRIPVAPDQFATPNYARALRTELIPRLPRPTF